MAARRPRTVRFEAGSDETRDESAMDVELLEIRDFLAAAPPFRDLPDQAMLSVLEALTIRYARRDSALPETDAASETMYLLHTGALESRTTDGRILARYGEGDIVAERASAENGRVTLRALEDTLLYCLPLTFVRQLAERHPPLARALAPRGGRRLRSALQRPPPERPVHIGTSGSLDLVTTTLGDVVARSAAHLSPTTTIRETAERMSRERVTSMLLAERGRLVGIVTDRDLRLKVIAAGLDIERPVSDIMTPDPITAERSTFAHDALLRMARHRIHHLPVLDGETLVGVVTASDFVERRETSAIRLATALYRQDDIDGLAREAARVNALFAALVSSGASPVDIGRVVTGAVDALTIRLLELAERELGPPPFRYVWAVGGAQARTEWRIGSPQTSLLIVGEGFDQDADGAYAEGLARSVHEGLTACALCADAASDPGRTALEPDRRVTLERWCAGLASGLDEHEQSAPVPDEALLDLRGLRIGGGGTEATDAPLATARRFAADRVGGDPRRVARLVRTALTHHPPRGFFRDGVTLEGGATQALLDSRREVIGPIVDLARALALASGEDPLTTRERLAAAVDGGELDAAEARDLRDALDFTAGVRARHHARGLAAGDRPNEGIPPATLSRVERDTLEDVFAIVREAQRRLVRRHGR